MTRTSKLIFFLFISITTISFGQKTLTSSPEWAKNNFLVSYYGDYITNPGLQIAFESALLNKIKVKSKVRRGKGTTKFKTKRLELVPSFSFYHDQGSHTAFIPNVAMQYKKVNHHRWLMTVGLGAGLFGNFLANSYEVNGNEVAEPKLGLTSYPAASIHWSFGRVKQNNGKMTGINIGITNQVIFNFNNSIQISPALNLGYRF